MYFSLTILEVEMGGGFSVLGDVLWNVLDRCKESNDVHSAKVIMMLSQVSRFLSLSLSLLVRIRIGEDRVFR